MKIRLFLAYALFFISLVGHSQDVGYVQPIGIELFNNPGLGASGSNWLRTNIRIDDSYGSGSPTVMHSTGYRHSVQKINSNFGGMYSRISNPTSDFTQNRYDLNFCYQFRLNRKITLIPAADVAFVYTNLAGATANYTTINIGGVIQNSDKFKIGYAMHNLNEPSNLGGEVPQRHNVFGIGQIRLNRKNRLGAFANLNYQGGFSNNSFGLLWQRQRVMLGGGIRLNDSFFGLARVRFGPFAIRYAYDTQKGVMSNTWFSSHEIGLDLRIGSRKAPGRIELGSISF